MAGTLRKYLEERLKSPSHDYQNASNTALEKSQYYTRQGSKDLAEKMAEISVDYLPLDHIFHPNESFRMGPLDLSATNKKILESIKSFYKNEGFTCIDNKKISTSIPQGKFQTFIFYFQKEKGTYLQVTITRSPRSDDRELLVSYEFRKF